MSTYVFIVYCQATHPQVTSAICRVSSPLTSSNFSPLFKSPPVALSPVIAFNIKEDLRLQSARDSCKDDWELGSETDKKTRDTVEELGDGGKDACREWDAKERPGGKKKVERYVVSGGSSRG